MSRVITASLERERERERERDCSCLASGVSPGMQLNSDPLCSCRTGSKRGTEEGTATHMHVHPEPCILKLIHVPIYQYVPFKASRLTTVGHMVPICTH